MQENIVIHIELVVYGEQKIIHITFLTGMDGKTFDYTNLIYKTLIDIF